MPNDIKYKLCSLLRQIICPEMCLKSFLWATNKSNFLSHNNMNELWKRKSNTPKIMWDKFKFHSSTSEFTLEEQTHGVKIQRIKVFKQKLSKFTCNKCKQSFAGVGGSDRVSINYNNILRNNMIGKGNADIWAFSLPVQKMTQYKQAMSQEKSPSSLHSCWESLIWGKTMSKAKNS